MTYNLTLVSTLCVKMRLHEQDLRCISVDRRSAGHWTLGAGTHLIMHYARMKTNKGIVKRRGKSRDIMRRLAMISVSTHCYIHRAATRNALIAEDIRYVRLTNGYKVIKSQSSGTYINRELKFLKFRQFIV